MHFTLHANARDDTYCYVNCNKTTDSNSDNRRKSNGDPLPYHDCNAADYPAQRGVRPVFAADGTLTFPR